MLIAKLLIGLFLLIKGADLLINSSITIGKKYRISDLVIGIIIIGFGTSLSELLVSIDAVLKNAPELSIGNIFGSNIANILLVIGVCGLTKTIKIPKISNFDNYFHLLITFLVFLIFLFYRFNFFTGIIFISLFVIYIYILIKNIDHGFEESSDKSNDKISMQIYKNPIFVGLPIIIFSIFLIIYGADLTVLSAIEISKIFGISESVIGLTIVALGTSLPEIAAGISSAKKGKGDLIIGNIIGSNLYNIMLILGSASLFKNFFYVKENTIYEIYFLFFCSIVLFLILKTKKEINLIISVFFVLSYLAYLTYIFIKNFLI